MHFWHLESHIKQGLNAEIKVIQFYKLVIHVFPLMRLHLSHNVKSLDHNKTLHYNSLSWWCPLTHYHPNTHLKHQTSHMSCFNNYTFL